MNARARVIKPHKSEFPVPIKLVKGEQIEGKVKKTTWDGWIWCKSPTGVNGWVPQNYLQASQKKKGWFIVLKNYNARELSAQENEILHLSEEVSEWVWATTKDGQSGWIPLENIERI